MVESVHRCCPDSEFLCRKFSTARLEILPNLRHAGVFQMSTMVILGIGFQKAYCSLRNEMERNEMKRNEMKICSLRNANL